MAGAAAPDTAGAPRGAPVDVLSNQRIGPFDVTRLAADDPTALATWLSDKGFPHPDGLDRNLAPYVADGWEVVAIQLVPAEQGESLTGDLQPLRLSFATDSLVYPMRLSRSATMPQFVDLYVLADHRMDPTATPVAGVQPSLAFAGRVEKADVSAALAPYVGDGAFLTRWTDHIFDPAAIDGDYVFAPASTDSAYQQVIYRTRNRGDITGLLLLAAVVAGGVVVAVRWAAGHPTLAFDLDEQHPRVRCCRRETRCNSSGYPVQAAAAREPQRDGRDHQQQRGDEQQHHRGQRA